MVRKYRVGAGRRRRRRGGGGGGDGGRRPVWWVVAATRRAFQKKFGQVQLLCAEPGKVLVLVSRFLFFPIQNHFFGKMYVHQKPLRTKVEPTGAGGYMRKQRCKSKDSQHWRSLQALSTSNGDGVWQLRGVKPPKKRPVAPLEPVPYQHDNRCVVLCTALQLRLRRGGLIAAIDPPSAAPSGVVI